MAPAPPVSPAVSLSGRQSDNSQRRGAARRPAVSSFSRPSQWPTPWHTHTRAMDARRHYEHFVFLWSDADEYSQRLLDEARTALARPVKEDG